MTNTRRRPRRIWKKLKKFYRATINPVAHVTLYPLVGLAIGLACRILCRTVRVTCVGGERPDARWAAEGPLVFAMWHGRHFMMMRLLARHRCAVMCSLSEIGELQAWIIRAFGFRPVRGSSSRGGVEALVNLIRMVRKEGRHAIVTVDGPSGPAFQAKPGAVQIALKSGARLVPVTVANRRRMIIPGAWDRFEVPLPFTRSVIIFGEPISYDLISGDEGMQTAVAELTGALTRMTARADGTFRPAPPC
ncbi:MAG: lysophospholipid acyltransferase family protein [Planctomycetota bacterium]